MKRCERLVKSRVGKSIPWHVMKVGNLGILTVYTNRMVTVVGNS